MPKADIELVKMVMMRNELDLRTVSQILEDINNELSNQEEPDRAPPVKKQFCIVVSDPNNELEGKDFTGWVVQIPEDESPMTAVERVTRAAYDFNQSLKGRRMPVTRIGEACECVSAKFLKEHGVWVKTKEPVLVSVTNNKIDWNTPQQD